MTAEESPSTGSGVLGWGSRYVLSSSDSEALQQPWEGVAVAVLHGLRAVPIGARRLAVGQRALRSRSNDGTVRSRMDRSLNALRVRTYVRSRCSISKVLTVERPLTCHSPVIPGRTENRGWNCEGNILASHSRHGRGPTSDMSASSTLSS